MVSGEAIDMDGRAYRQVELKAIQGMNIGFGSRGEKYFDRSISTRD